MDNAEEVHEPERQGGRWARTRLHAYTWSAVALVAVLAVVTVLGVLGTTGPGVLSVGEALFILGGAAIVLTVAVVGLLVTLRRTLNLVHAKADKVQTLIGQHLAEAEATASSQAPPAAQVEKDDTTSQELDWMWTELSSRIQSLDAELDITLTELDRDAASRTTSQAPTTGEQDGQGAAQPTPFGDIHEVTDVEGIAETYAGRLAELGIEDTEQLWLADPEQVAARTGAPRATVDAWQAMAELMALAHVGPQYAELLVRAGIRSIDELAQADADALAHAVQEVEAGRQNRIQGNKITAKHTARWIQAAQEHEDEPVPVQR